MNPTIDTKGGYKREPGKQTKTYRKQHRNYSNSNRMNLMVFRGRTSKIDLHHYMPQASVIMPVWNGENHLRAAIESVLAQTFEDFELLVIDDGSTDATASILASYRDQRLRIIRRQHEGIVKALNHGVTEARAEFIARMDADDICATDRLAVQIRHLRMNSSAVLCHSKVRFLSDTPELSAEAHFPKSRALLAMRLCFQCPIVHSSVVFRKDAFHAAGGYFSAERHAEDFGLWGRLIRIGPFIGVRQPLIHFRLHSASISQKSSQTQKEVSQKIAKAHCEKFMALSESSAIRAFRILAALPDQRKISEWLWFLTHAAPRLQWKSAELATWLGIQTIRTVARWTRT